MLANGDLGMKFWMLLFAGVSMGIACTIGVLQIILTNRDGAKRLADMEDRHHKERLAWSAYRGICEGKVLQFRKRGA